ncbi:hypothetical protein CLOSCI_03715 [[Clostridium] scindens ATCC 35704]|nr:hypothetical protein CLOSCI_03715 [[Clostridium] scindens ATCC 35704]
MITLKNIRIIVLLFLSIQISTIQDITGIGNTSAQDYFLNEDDLFDDEAGVEGFYIF